MASPGPNRFARRKSTPDKSSFFDGNTTSIPLNPGGSSDVPKSAPVIDVAKVKNTNPPDTAPAPVQGVKAPHSKMPHDDGSAGWKTTLHPAEAVVPKATRDATPNRQVAGDYYLALSGGFGSDPSDYPKKRK